MRVEAPAKTVRVCPSDREFGVVVLFPPTDRGRLSRVLWGGRGGGPLLLSLCACKQTFASEPDGLQGKYGLELIGLHDEPIVLSCGNVLKSH